MGDIIQWLLKKWSMLLILFINSLGNESLTLTPTIESPSPFER
jgi:hypothetical protein